MALSAAELGVIKQAWWRQRRRRIAAAVPIVAIALGAIIAAGGGGTHRQFATARPGPTLGPGIVRSPAAVFVQDPYMGVACHIPNSIACDRVGLSVWLRRPAQVTATIAGAPLTLDDPTWSYAVHRGRHSVYVYAGFLQPAGLLTRFHLLTAWAPTWSGAYAPSPPVSFRIEYGRGHAVLTSEHVQLEAGWG